MAKKVCFNLIFDIEKKVEKIFKTLNIFFSVKDIKKAIQQKKRFFYVSFLKKRKKFFIKIRILQDKKEAKEKIKNEIFFIKLLTNLSKKKEIKINFPKYINSNFKTSPEWLIREYIHGKLFGYSYHNLFPKSEKTKYFKKIAKNLESLQNLTKEISNYSKQNKLSFFKRSSKIYFQRLKEFQKKIDFFDHQINFRKIYNLLDQGKKTMDVNLVLTHGDIVVSNIIVTNNQKVYIIDWEHIRIDNFAADFALLWMHLWKYKKWREVLLKEFLKLLNKKKQKDFLKVFQIDVIDQILEEIARWDHKKWIERKNDLVQIAYIKNLNIVLNNFKKII